MRIEIKSTDRIGIGYEILATFAAQQWNIKAVEIETGVTYVHLEAGQYQFTAIKRLIENIEGVNNCRTIDLLPSERKAKHLTALLAKVPDAIIDIDQQGIILAANEAAQSMLSSATVSIVGQNFEILSSKNILLNLSGNASSVELTIAEQNYIADITPVIDGKQVNGAVVVLRTMRNLGRQISLMQARGEQQLENIIGQSIQIKQLKTKTRRFAQLMLPVLILGETGTGKELFARALHEASSRAAAPFLAINCAALPENLLESELFGYAAGAFTGAQRGGKPGLLELASGGTVFLDEIAEMSTYLQAKLLRFLQDFKFRRVGGTRELTADVRIISATHQNLNTNVKHQQFRDDLFYRLNVLTLDLPSLRQRIEDISELSQYFIQQAALQTNCQTPSLTETALTSLLNYSWPGNIRELQNCLFRVVALLDHAQITKLDIDNVLNIVNEHQTNKSGLNTNEITDWSTAQAQFERSLLQQLYPLYPTTRKLAQRLSVSHNKIAMKLKQHGIG